MRPSTRSRSHHDPLGPYDPATNRWRFSGGKHQRKTRGNSDTATDFQPLATPASGATMRAGSDRGFEGVFQSTCARRTSTRTRAPVLVQERGGLERGLSGADDANVTTA